MKRSFVLPNYFLIEWQHPNRLSNLRAMLNTEIFYNLVISLLGNMQSVFFKEKCEEGLAKPLTQAGGFSTHTPKDAGKKCTVETIFTF